MKSILKRALLALALLSTAVAASAQMTATGSPFNGLSNGVFPTGYPPSIYVKHVADGSGTPQPGVYNGYDRADYVGGGLYQVPGYLPYDPSGDSIESRVIELPCHQEAKRWNCAGYSVTPAVGRGEYILIQPVFQH
jgi:hypothetical protein